MSLHRGGGSVTLPVVISEPDAAAIGRYASAVLGFPLSFQTVAVIMDTRDGLLVAYRARRMHAADEDVLDSLIARITHPNVSPFRTSPSLIRYLSEYEIFLANNPAAALAAELASRGAQPMEMSFPR